LSKRSALHSCARLAAMDRPADWQCPNVSCVNSTRMVFGSKAECPKCGAPKEEAFNEPAVSDERPTDWQCPNESCVNHTRMVFGSKAECPKCGASKDDIYDGGYQEPQMRRSAPPSRSFVAMKVLPEREVVPGGYRVAPMARGREDRYHEEPLPERGMVGGDMEDDWACPDANCINHTKMVFGKKASCPACGTARNAKTPGDWLCPNTECVNSRNTVFASKMSCPKCGTQKPLFGNSKSRPSVAPAPSPRAMTVSVRPLPVRSQTGARAPSRPVPMPRVQMAPVVSGAPGAPGDWQCPNSDCLNHKRMVFGKNDACPKCGAEKPVPRGRGGRGGSFAEDWQCPTPDCQNHRNKVFAKHQSCPQCGAEKPNGRARSRSPYR